MTGKLEKSNVAENNQPNTHKNQNTKEHIQCCLTLKIKIKTVGLVLDWLHVHLRPISHSSTFKTSFQFI